MQFDILITGVGGQGTVLASRLLAIAAIHCGWTARTAETIGMAQRGGSVTSHVRIGDKHKASIIPDGKANLLIGYEPAEAARSIQKLATDGKCLVNMHPIQSVLSALDRSYTDTGQIRDYISAYVPDALLIDARKLCGATNVKALNIILLGVATGAGYLPFTKEIMMEVIQNTIPKNYLEMNLEAFCRGFDIGSKNQQ
ncbi:MAG: pyruvate ferredoxin oxidoreductase [Peptococcaceae bacterium]|nr:pyruvate ferredoxin oxidoreductase [Peptococcaceae bacterium]